MTDATDPTWGGEPPRAALTLEPEQVAVLYPCLEPQPHEPHRREGIDGATLWAYRCNGEGGIVHGEDEPLEFERARPTTIYVPGVEPIYVDAPLCDQYGRVDPADWQRYRTELAAAHDTTRLAAVPFTEETPAP